MNTLNFVQRLRNENIKMTSTQKKLKQYLLDHTADVGYMSLRELSENAGISEVSILNFCNLLGFQSYVAMREQLRAYIRNQMQSLFFKSPSASLIPEQRDELYRYCAHIADSHNKMLQGLDLSQMERCARALIQSENILVCGHDMSKMAADYLASRLTYLQIRCQSVNLGDNDTVQILLAGMSARDSAIIFSFPPYYVPAGDVADYVRHCGANLIAVANGMDSPVVTEGGINFICEAENPYFFNSMSVPVHFVEVLAYYVATIMGKKSGEILNTMNTVGSYFRHNKV